jgi:peroxiredoxin Q/BCP
MALQVGERAPEFELSAVTAEGAKTVRLAEFKGRKVVLYFYPKDDTPGCTKEACAFRDFTAEFEKKGAVILGVSPDDEKKHAKFIGKFTLPFPLLADVGSKVCEAYGVWVEKSMYGRQYMGVERTTFLIDEDGVIRRIFPKVKVEGHVDEVLSALDSI